LATAGGRESVSLNLSPDLSVPEFPAGFPAALDEDFPTELTAAADAVGTF
jgi:hypothetical protein